MTSPTRNPSVVSTIGEFHSILWNEEYNKWFYNIHDQFHKLWKIMKNYQTIKISAHPDHYYPLKLLNTQSFNTSWSWSSHPIGGRWEPGCVRLDYGEMTSCSRHHRWKMLHRLMAQQSQNYLILTHCPGFLRKNAIFATKWSSFTYLRQICHIRIKRNGASAIYVILILLLSLTLFLSFYLSGSLSGSL